MTAVLELFQTEWCPASHRVRERLTELGVDYVIRQVPADKTKRQELLAATGSDTVPVLATDAGRVLEGEDRIVAYLGEHYLEPRGAWMHGARAEKTRRRSLDEGASARSWLHAEWDDARVLRGGRLSALGPELAADGFGALRDRRSCHAVGASGFSARLPGRAGDRV